MHHRIHAVLGEERQHRGALADLPHHQRRVAYRLAKAARQVIEHHHALAARAQLQHHVTADVACPAGD